MKSVLALAGIALAVSTGAAMATVTGFTAVPEIDVLAGGAAVAVAGATLALIRHRAKR